MNPISAHPAAPRRSACRIALASLLLAWLVACGGGGSGSTNNQPPETTPRIQAQVDSSVAPRLLSTTARPLAAVVGETGAQVDFVAGELLVITDDDAALRDLLARHQGSVVKTTRFAAEGLVGMPTLHQVRVTRLEAVDTARL